MPMVGVAIGVLIVIGLVWWLIGKMMKSGAVRTTVRLVVSVAILVAAVVFVPRLLPNLTSATPVSAQSAVKPSDSTTVELGSLVQTLGAAGALAPVKSVDLSFQQSATVTDVLVKVGQTVKAGDVLAKIDDTDAQASLRSAQISLESAQNAYDELVATPRPVDVAVQKAALNSAQASYASAVKPTDPNTIEQAQISVEQAKNSLWQAQLSRDETMKNGPEFRTGNGGAQAGEISMTSGLNQDQSQVDIANENLANTLNTKPDAGSVASASASILQAQINLDNLINGPDANDLRTAQITLENAQLGVQTAQAGLSKTQLIAPTDGVIAAVNLQVGELPDSTSTDTSGAAITLVDNSKFTIDLSVDESDVINLAVGQKVNISVDALPDQKLTGTITKIESQPTVANNIVTYTATVTLDPTQAPIRPGMNATVNIILSQLDNVLLVPNSYITTNATTQQHTVIIKNDAGAYVPTPVTIGARGTSQTEILSGLQEGQDIYLLPASSGTGAGGRGGFFGGPVGGGGAPGGGGGGGGFRGG
jgi:HlyD family secretion protein